MDQRKCVVVEQRDVKSKKKQLIKIKVQVLKIQIKNQFQKKMKNLKKKKFK